MAEPHSPLFDPRRRRRMRERVSRGLPAAGFLHARVADDLAERLEAVNRSFERVVVFGDAGHFQRALESRPTLGAKFARVWRADRVSALAARPGFVAEPERLPLSPASVDLVVSVLDLHAVEDLVGALIQIRLALRPDGLFIASLFGGDTLHELRAALLAAEAASTGGAALRVAPFGETRALGDLLQRAGFALPVADLDRVIVRYPHLFSLAQDLRAMGESAPLRGPIRPLSRATLAAAADAYSARSAGSDGKVPATFDLVTLTGWAPHESQQKPLRPGSAKQRLADAVAEARAHERDPS